ncbi:hypothetical protein Golax_003018 [Gossypium laxum]|uniref:Uncharacterized protein n=1 Tax=Gossypium laxum TaxID=34288 RepID=A0A7J9AE36_9ROSI|nr:hypothetical protein [Gossypium laxum]
MIRRDYGLFKQLSQILKEILRR